MNTSLQQRARHADLSGPKHTASAQHERIARHSVSYTPKTEPPVAELARVDGIAPQVPLADELKLPAPPAWVGVQPAQ